MTAESCHRYTLINANPNQHSNHPNVVSISPPLVFGFIYRGGRDMSTILGDAVPQCYLESTDLWHYGSKSQRIALRSARSVDGLLARSTRTQRRGMSDEL